MKKFIICLYRAIVKTIASDGVEHAGYMSFMLIMSMFPFLVFFLSATSFFGASEIGRSLIEIIIESSPDNVIGSLKIRFEELKSTPPTSLLNLAIFGTIWTSSSFVEGMRTILNRILEIKSPPPYFIRRFLSILQFIMLSAMLAIVMLIFVFIPVLIEKVRLHNIIQFTNMWSYWKHLYIFLCLFFWVISFYIFIPNSKININQTIPGAIFTTITWQISGFLLSKYIQYYHQLSLVYGSLGSIIVTLIFFYIINFLFIIGAAFNYHFSMYGKEHVAS